MATKISALAILLAAAALGLAAFRRPEPPALPASSKAEVVALRQQVEALTREVEAMREGRARAGGPAPAATPAPPPGAIRGMAPLPESGESLRDLVDDAVAKKTREVVDDLKAKEDKKPSMDEFAATLELTDEQRRAAEREVIRAQAEIVALLETPTADGRNFMDELVDLYAKSMAEPDKDPGWGLWYLSLTAMKVPGTDETYAARAEVVKDSLRASFRRTFSEAQYAEFAAWKMDPTEIEDVEGSPYDDVGRRITDRARQLGIEVPDEEK